ncbi:MAG: hypothetical protein GX141_02670 [Armatimonadetes bacterium]|jgi:TM2 domain-containing membrane protein YozV|nr:hypothetical protein [Armatimonadota bacterium]
MPIRAALKIISLFLALAAFLVVGIHSLYFGEELVWAVGKALITFIICWLLIGWFAGLLSGSVEAIESTHDGSSVRQGGQSHDG